MKKLLFVASLALGLGVGAAFADEVSVKVPVDQNGQAVGDVSLSGVKFSVRTASAAVATVPVLFYGLIMEEGAATQDYVVYDSTFIANGACPTNNPTDTCDQLTPPINPGSTSLESVRLFDPPIRTNNGLSIDFTDQGTADDVTVLYVERKE